MKKRPIRTQKDRWDIEVDLYKLLIDKWGFEDIDLTWNIGDPVMPKLTLEIYDK